MSTLLKNKAVEPVDVMVTRHLLTVELADGRVVSAPTEWFPRLAHGTPAEWVNFELMYDGIHWPDLNEDISVDGLLNGEKSGESPAAIKRWLDLRARGKRETIPELPLPSEIAKELEKIGVLQKKPVKKPNRVVEVARLKHTVQ